MDDAFTFADHTSLLRRRSGRYHWAVRRPVDERAWPTGARRSAIIFQGRSRHVVSASSAAGSGEAISHGWPFGGLLRVSCIVSAARSCDNPAPTQIIFAP
jgi:hypothetical protein